MKIKLTKQSEIRLMQWNAGAGQIFVSDGEHGFKYSDIFFTRNNDNYFIAIGNRKAIKLTEEQIKIIGDFFFTNEVKYTDRPGESQ